MEDPQEAALADYPHGRGYGHDYMRGGEVLGGYGYAERDEYAKVRGEMGPPEAAAGTTAASPPRKTVRR